MRQKIRFTVVPGKRLGRVVRITMNPHYGIPTLMEKNLKFRASLVRGQIREMATLSDR
jgi:hypothetical protein